MIDVVWLPVAAVAGVALTLLAQFAWRMARGSRDLGSDAERATFRTLTLASRAAVHLRGGLETGEVVREEGRCVEDGSGGRGGGHAVAPCVRRSRNRAASTADPAALRCSRSASAHPGASVASRVPSGVVLSTAAMSKRSSSA